MAPGMWIALLLWGQDYAELLKKGNDLLLRGEAAKALEVMRAGARETGDEVLRWRFRAMEASALISLGEREQAEEILTQVIAAGKQLGNQKVECNGWYGMGQLRRMEGEPEESIRMYQKCLQLKDGIGGRLNEAGIWNNIGIAYRTTGRLRAALDAYQKALRLYEAEKVNQGVAGMLNNIGNLYLKQGQVELAQQSFEKGLAVGPATGLRGQLLSNLGRAQAMKENYAEARRLATQALQLREKSGDRNGVARTEVALGEMAGEMGRRREAIGHFERALAIFEETGNEADQPITRASLAQMQIGDDAARALLTAREAEQAAEAAQQPEALWKARNARGEALRALGRGAEAEAAFAEAVETVEELRRFSSGSEVERQSFFEDRLAPYRNAFAAAAERGDAPEALVRAERMKARVLGEVLEGSRARAQFSPEQRSEQKRLRAEISKWNQALQGEKNVERRKELAQRRRQAGLAYEAFRTRAYSAAREEEVMQARVGEVEARQAAGTGVILEYVVTRDKAWMLMGDRRGFEVVRLGVGTAELLRRAEAFREAVGNRDLAYVREAQALYRVLIGPAEKYLGKDRAVVIVPDGGLWNLPFAALRREGGRHLLEERTVSYAPSIGALLPLQKRRRRPVPDTLVAYADVTGGEGSLPRLRETAELGKDLTRLYANHVLRMQGEATEAKLREDLGKAGVIQFAGHGVYVGGAPLDSYLVLSPQAGEDGMLEAWEVLEMKTRARLAVLTGCETGRGRTAAGEGILGLGWSFLIAGVADVVMSHWRVEAAASTALTLGFHEKLREGMTPAGALRAAARRIASAPETGHPFYWAGFFALGGGNESTKK